jgi:hypothetical protein
MPYATYFLLCELNRRGIDGLFEQYGARKRSTDFEKGEKLGVHDHIIILSKPKKEPDWMSLEEYDKAPNTLKVREFRAGGKIMVTTFLCPKKTPKSMLKVLYHSRWNVELDLRNIKTTLGRQRSCVARLPRWSHRPAKGWLASRTDRAACIEATSETVSIAYQTEADSERGGQEKWASKEATLNSSKLQRVD